MIVIPLGQGVTITNENGSALFTTSDGASITIRNTHCSVDEEGTITISDTFVLPNKQEYVIR